MVLCKERLQVMAGKEVVICEGNYFRTSQGMEGEAFRRLVDYLNGVRLLPYLHDFVCNQDSSVLSILNSNSRLQHINIQHDPGHTKNNVVKHIYQTLGGSKAVQGLAVQIRRWITTVLHKAVLMAQEQA